MPEADAAVNQVGIIPVIVLGGYLVMLLVFGVVGYLRSTGSEEDYYLAGRGQGWIVSSLTIMATFFSSFALLGAPGKVYQEGVAFALFALNVPLSGAAVFFLGSKISRMGRVKAYVTPADMISEYYDSPVALRLLPTLIGFLYAVPYVVIQIQAGGLLSAQMFGEDAFVTGSIVLAGITMLYIMVGGMRSVAWTDVVQGLLLLCGMLLGGLTIVIVLGGPVGLSEGLGKLPRTSLSLPGTTGSFSPEMILTVCMFASLGSMIQPAQWMRYYAAESSNTLRRSALIFAIVLTTCYLFGTMLVGLGGQALYPLVGTGETAQANAQVGKFDQILAVVLNDNLPALFQDVPLGPTIGATLASLFMVAIMAASMSTADSNLHALSAVLTRDVYDRFLRPNASQSERTWVGRGIIALATLLAVWLIIEGQRNENFKPVRMITDMAFVAIAFSSQLLPITFDMLYVRKGSRAGAISGIIVGLAIVFMFTPWFSDVTALTADGESMQSMVKRMSKMIDKGAWGLIGNVAVFALVSLVTRRPDPARVAEFARIMKGKPAE